VHVAVDDQKTQSAAETEAWTGYKLNSGGMAMAGVPFPHRYQVNATADRDGDVVLLAGGLQALRSQPPQTFGGPGDRWSPETLLVGAVADCFALTFRAVAGLAKLRWESLECEAEGTLDRVDRVAQFTAFRIRACLKVPSETDREEGQRLLLRAKENCLISHSLKAPCEFESHVELAERATAAA
jgi:organic hydroperoxide reductase OsmC/OhrA